MASPDQPPHVPLLLPTAPLLLYLPRSLVPILLFLTCGRLRLPHSLLRLSPTGAILLPLSQSRHQSKSLPWASHAHSQGSEQSELLPRPGHTHTQSVSQSLQLTRLFQLFTEISLHLFSSSFSFHFLVYSLSFFFFFSFPLPFFNVNGILVHVGLWSPVITGQTDRQCSQSIEKAYFSSLYSRWCPSCEKQRCTHRYIMGK